MQPTFRQTPPQYLDSTIATDLPSCAARTAAVYPPGPAPRTTTSKCALMGFSLDAAPVDIRRLPRTGRRNHPRCWWHSPARGIPSARLARDGQGTDRDTKGPDNGPHRGATPAHRRTRRIAAAALIAACTGIATGVAQAADTGPAPNTAKRATGITSVHGSGGGELQFSGFEGDQVNFDIRGHTTEADSPVSVKGTFAVTHERPDGTLFAEMSGSLDCMWVAGDVAVATGVIEEYDMPGLPELEPAGRRVGFTIDDGGRHD